VVKSNDFGLKNSPLISVKGGTAQNNAPITRNILTGKDKGPKRDIVLMNAAACFLMMGKVKIWKQGVELSKQLIENQLAIKKLEELIYFTNN